MNSTLTKVFIFLGGAAVGAAASWKLLKIHFERITREEIDSVKEYYSNRQSNPVADDTETVNDEPEDTTTTEESTEDDKPTHRDYAAILAKTGYTRYSTTSVTEEKKEEPAPSEGPYVISPEEFGSRDDYDTVSLTYYADEVLADDMDEPVTDVNDVVGLESLNCFGDYEDDCVFVRNDDLKTDFEILADTRRYIDVVGRSITGV